MESHKENLESAKEWYKIVKEQNNQLAIEILEKIFPELAESEDEKIRKEMIRFFQSKKTFESDKWIAWLEKQKCNTTIKFSEEDERMIDTIIYDLERHGGKVESCYSAEIHWLKSLKERLVPIC